MGIEWPIDTPVLADKDRGYPHLEVLAGEHLLKFEAKR
ncbi:MAG: hypothetical protein MIO92_12945 [Methanosarcinaceae archaeon]|nr:hypothetical protein [Methanosarcinaceae archaeon]